MTERSRISGPTPDPSLSEFDEPLDGAPAAAIAGLVEVEPRAAADDLKRKTAVSILWTIVRTGSDYILSFIVFAVLARKLGPAAFGVYALAVAFAEVGKVLPSSGLIDTLTRAKRVSPEMADTVFWSTLVLSGLVAVVIALVAQPLGRAFGAPEVAPLVTALGCIVPITAAGATHMAMRLREFGHRSLASRSVVSGVLGGVAALTAAWAGWGAWSLVVQRGVSEVAGTAMAWQAYPWMPGRRYSGSMLRQMAGLSASMTGTQILNVALVRVQDVVIGRVIGPAAVGVYRTAWRTIDLIAQGAILPFAQVSLPALARLQDDLPAFRKAYLRLIGVSSALAFPAIIGFAVLAPSAIPLIFGDRWTESASIAQILGFLAVPFTLNRFAAPGLAALGRSGTLARLAVLQVVLTIILSLIAAPFGLTAMAWAYVFRAYLTLPPQMYAFKRHSGLGYGPVLGAIAPGLLMALIMAGVLLLVGPMTQIRFPDRVLFVLVMTLIGTAVYVVSLLVFARGFVLEQVGDFRKLVRV
ncbi:MAG TPA: lipopolysaccharide biosynthesis protein [Gemmatimonadales bacterium]|jgi:O-antigen/teichoic acid export membrane protein